MRLHFAPVLAAAAFALVATSSVCAEGVRQPLRPDAVTSATPPPAPRKQRAPKKEKTRKEKTKKEKKNNKKQAKTDSTATHISL